VVRRLSFTVAREPLELEIGGEEFTAPPVIAPAALAEVLNLREQVGEISTEKVGDGLEAIPKILKVLGDAFTLILVPESAERFRERLASRDNPFDLMREVIPALVAITEEYTDRPTPPSSPSSAGSTNDGTSSTDGAPAEESTPSTSTPAGS